MQDNPSNVNRRILVIDDNRAIHEDFAKILCRDTTSTAVLAQSEAQIFGDSRGESSPEAYQIDSAFQGEEGFEMVRAALTKRRPYALAFIDVRMPPGWDGIETASRIWEVDPQIQIVLCTAYSDYSWAQIRTKLGDSDRLVVLKKPFDNIEVLQLAETLSRKWQRAHAGSRHLAALQQMIRDRSNELTGKTDAPALADDELAMAAQMVDTQVQEHLVLENELRQAIERGELAVHYQPLVAITTQHPVSVEALVRWEHPTKGWIPPVRFIPIAEESGLIFALGEFVLRTACAQVREWELAGIAVVPVAVNVSAMQLQDQNFVAIVRDILRETGLRPNLLALELTESALLENMQDHIPALRTLRSDGIAIEIDDFGTGYSSLSYLKELPLDAVKIDRSFIREVDVNPVDAAILSAIVAMAHSVNLRVVAEGVETAQQLQVIGRHACDIAQGYFFARPMPAEECANFLVEASERDSLIDNVRAATSGFAATH